MSEENVETVRALFDQFAVGDFSRWFAGVTEDFEFTASPEVPDAGTYHGEEARRWITAWVESFEGHTMEATEFADAGENVLVGILQRGRPHGSEIAVEGQWWGVFTLREGAVSRVELFPGRAEAVQVAGLGE